MKKQVGFKLPNYSIPQLFNQKQFGAQKEFRSRAQTSPIRPLQEYRHHGPHRCW
jgi:hypothetical protein